VDMSDRTNSKEFMRLQDGKVIINNNGQVSSATDLLQIRQSASHSGNYLECQTSGGVPVTYIKADGSILAGNKVIFTQTDGNEYIDSLADGYLDLGATNDVRINNNLDVIGIQKYENAFVFTLTAGSSNVAVAYPTAFAGGVIPVVICTPPYQTSFWITNITNTGFTFNVGTTNIYNQSIQCIAMETS